MNCPERVTMASVQMDNGSEFYSIYTVFGELSLNSMFRVCLVQNEKKIFWDRLIIFFWEILDLGHRDILIQIIDPLFKCHVNSYNLSKIHKVSLP